MSVDQCFAVALALCEEKVICSNLIQQEAHAGQSDFFNEESGWSTFTQNHHETPLRFSLFQRCHCFCWECPQQPIAKKGELLFSDDFERSDLGEWKPLIPAFSVQNGVLKGLQRGGRRLFSRCPCRDEGREVSRRRA